MSSCRFINNSAIRFGILVYDECAALISHSLFLSNNGAVCCIEVDKSNVTVTKSNFTQNFSPYTASVFHVIGDFSEFLSVSGNSNTLPSPSGLLQIVYFRFDGNYVRNGGSFFAQSMKFVLLSECIFWKNSAIIGGIAMIRNSILIILNCTVSQNSASAHAGALSLTDHSTLLVENTVFNNNTCVIEGGAIKANRNSTLNISNSSFTGNKALGSDGGGIYLADESWMVTTQCLFMNNTAAVSGGAILVIDHSTYYDSGEQIHVKHSIRCWYIYTLMYFITSHF